MMQPFLAVPLELPSLITFLAPPLLSQQQAKIRLWIHKGKSGQLRSEGPTTTISRNCTGIPPYSYTRGLSRRKIIIPVRRNEDRSRGWPVMKLDACQKQIANIFVVSPFSLSLCRNFYNRHSSLECNIFMRFFSRVYKRREEVLDLILAPIEKNLNVMIVVLPRCGNCLR